MAEYNYTRGTIANGEWDINNPDRVDGSGNQIWLGDEVKTAIPNEAFKLECDGASADFTFTNTLTTEQETTLTTTVNNHKNNT